MVKQDSTLGSSRMASGGGEEGVRCTITLRGTGRTWVLRDRGPSEEWARRGRAERWEGLLGPAEQFGFVRRGEGDTAAFWAAGWRLLTSPSVGSKETQ